MMKSSQPSPLELQVLSVLWADGPSTVREVLDRLPDGRSRAYTTVLSVLQTMEAKALVSRRTGNKAHVYKFKKTENQILPLLVKNLTTNVFGGSSAKLIETALKAGSLTVSEKKQLQEQIKAHKPIHD
ncbi:MAG: BlaI family penicillinase repressor [Verrucomicrobiales bacterium]|jgi:BlaI family penicillinase repressor